MNLENVGSMFFFIAQTGTVSSEAVVFFRLNRVPVCSEAELLISIMTAKCKFTGKEKLLIISPHRKENFPNENFWTVEVNRFLSSFKRYCQSKFATNLNYNICLDFHLRFKMLIMRYIPEALRHTQMPELQPG